MAITTSTQMPAPVQQSFSRKLLAIKLPYLVHKIAATKKMMPRNGGKYIRMRRYDKLDTATVPLGNTGITPPAQQLSATDIDAEIQFYGTYVQINEQVTLQSQDPVLNEAAHLLGVSLRETEDELVRDMLAATAMVQSCVNGSNGDNPTEITAQDVQVAVRQLLNNDARSLMSNIEGLDKFGTSPIRNSFFALGHADLSADLDNAAGFVHVSQYPSQNNLMESEWGSIGNLRFLLSSKGSKVLNSSGNGNDLYNVFCVGLESFACIEQDGYSAEFIYRPPVYDGPLAQNVSLGYKFAQATRILNDSWILNLQCTLA